MELMWKAAVGERCHINGVSEVGKSIIVHRLFDASKNNNSRLTRFTSLCFMDRALLLFISLLAGLSYASPAIQAHAGVPEADNICRPVGIDKTVHYVLQSSSTPSSVWQAEGVTTTDFSFVNLQFIQPVNNGNSFAIVSNDPTTPVCANVDGGPLDSFACSTVLSTSQVAQSAQFFITCQSCAANNQGATSCQIQSANEGQCVSFLDVNSNTVKLDDCSSSQPNEFWDIIVAA
ncbi:hypothetical protein M422DRAFT_34805 [Sphaerobolus stellatus SS14]|uniref:Uncharacterized protein n=1 Tax=Sphaerobolus stellatus (strain SS14) TaxID=990650 RepID=A0A0C9TX97_SPHS4|nr:hypothetical protein M422DRAFT_34805 [Sphaerobolus stellatus SS14]